MDTDRFDHLTRVVATRRRGLAALIGAVALVISSPAADAKRKATRCEFETCRGVCCKHHQEGTVLGCTSRHNLGYDWLYDYPCSSDGECQLHNPFWICRRGVCTVPRDVS